MVAMDLTAAFMPNRGARGRGRDLLDLHLSIGVLNLSSGLPEPGVLSQETASSNPAGLFHRQGRVRIQGE
jgi:hypothetical protein